MTKDILSVNGDVHIVKTSFTGKKEEYRFKNLVVSAGKSYITSRMSSNIAAIMSHMAVGTSGASAAAGDTTLGTEIGRETLTLAGGTPSTNTITYSAVFPAGNATGSLAEAGILNAGSNGTLLCRTVFPTINKLSGDSVTITWTISLT